MPDATLPPAAPESPGAAGGGQPAASFTSCQSGRTTEWPMLDGFYQALGRGTLQWYDDAMNAERERIRRWSATAERAQALLGRCLSESQLASLARFRFFDLTSDRGHRWRIRCGGGQSGNVVLLDRAGRETACFCAHPRGAPDPAAWIAQMMMLSVDERGFLAVANLYGGGEEAARRVLEDEAGWPPRRPVLWRFRPGHRRCYYTNLGSVVHVRPWCTCRRRRR